MKDSKRMFGKAFTTLVAGVLLGTYVSVQARAETVDGWTLAGNESSCSLYRARNGQFVFLVVRSDKTTMLRFHDKDWPTGRVQSDQVKLHLGSDILTLPGNFAETSEGWGGVTAQTDDPSIINVVAASDNLSVGIGPVVLGAVRLDGLSQGVLALRKCAEELPPATSHVATPPELLSDLTFDWSELQVAAKPKGPIELQFQLILDDRGVASACQVVQSSGLVPVDEAACGLLQRRARFRPALDSAGHPVGSTYQRSISFRP